MHDIIQYWNQQAESFDDAPDHGGFDLVLCRHLLWAMQDLPAVLERWARLLKPSGQLVLIEGRWFTGAGITAHAVIEHLAARGRTATVTPLLDPALWGNAISDERYLVVSRAGD